MIELVHILSDQFVKETNTDVTKVSCTEFEKKVKANEQLVVFAGKYENLGKGKPMEGFTKA